jgi:hypothetical protein
MDMSETTTTPTIVSEDEYRWTVKCQGPDCQNVVNTPKVTYDPNGTRHETVLSPRGCLNHPPHTWVARRD